MEELKEIRKKIGDTEKTFQPKYDLMDKDFELWDGKETIFDSHGTAINVTSNSPRTFANDVQTDLASAEMQIAVRMAETRGEDKREDVGDLERLFYFLFEKADERLIALLLPALREYLIWCATIRGEVAVRILNYMEGNEVVPDYLPLDPRWSAYEVGGKGLAWHSYKMFKTKSALQDEWKYTPKDSPLSRLPLVGGRKLYEVYDYWKLDEKAVNCVFCGDDYLKEPTSYDLKRIPILVMPVSSRPPVVSSTEIGKYGEGIYAPNRGVYSLENKLASMWATHANILELQPLLNYMDDQGKELTDTILYAGGVYNLPMHHQEIKESPLKEISPTLVNLVNWVGDLVEHGSLPHLRLGTPPPSGTALNLIREAGNRIYSPQTRTLTRFYAGMCRMIEEQLLMGGVGEKKITKVEIKTEKDRKYYSAKITPVDLRKPHIIKVDFTVKTPWSQLDVAQQADMLKRLGLPDSWIWEFILKVPDPKLLEDLAAIEMAEHSPILAMKKAVEALMKYGRIDDAMSLVREMDKMEAQEEMAVGEEPPAPAPEGAGVPTPAGGMGVPPPMGGEVG